MNIQKQLEETTKEKNILVEKLRQLETDVVTTKTSIIKILGKLEGFQELLAEEQANGTAQS